MDGLSRQRDLEWIGVKHESVAAMMASAEAKLTGRIAVCAAQMGPGLTNLMTGLGDAYLDGAPVLAISGQAPVSKIGTNYKQYIDQQVLVQAITGFSRIVVHPDAIVDALKEAMYISLEKATPVHLSIPSDLWTLPCRTEPRKPIPRTNPVPVESTIRQAVNTMLGSKRPMMLVGNRAKHASDAIRKLADSWGCGIVMSYGVKGIIPDSHPYQLGGLGEGGNPWASGLFKQSDVVLAIGTSWWPEHHVPEHTQVIQMEERISSIGQVIPAQIGLVGDPAETIYTFLENMPNYRSDPKWVHLLNKYKKDWNAQNEREGATLSSPLHPASIIRVIEQTIDNDAIIALDEGDVTLWFLRTSEEPINSCCYRSVGERWDLACRPQ